MIRTSRMRYCRTLLGLGVIGMSLLSSCAISPLNPAPPFPQPTSVNQDLPTPTSDVSWSDGTLLITPATAPPGEVIKIRGSGFQPEETVTITVHAATQSYLYGAQALENGDYLQEIILLETLPGGIAVTIEATGYESGLKLSGSIQTTNHAGNK